MSTENKSIGRFILDGLLPSPRGVPQIEVAFDIDANGILNVSAKDRGTGKEQRITITASSGLAKDEVERLIKDAEINAEEDRRRREGVEAKNMAESLAYSVEKVLRENKDKIPDELYTEVNDKVATLRSTLLGQDTSAITTAMTDLQSSFQKIGPEIYGQVDDTSTINDESTEGEATTASEDEATPEDTVEGEFREV